MNIHGTTPGDRPVPLLADSLGRLTVSGEVNTTVSSIGTVGVSGTITANQGTAGANPWPISAGTIGVSGTAATPVYLGGVSAVSGNINIASLPTAVAVSGTITANQGTAGANPWPISAGTIGVSGTVGTPIYVGGVSAVSGTINIQIGGVAPGLDNTSILKNSLYARNLAAADANLRTAPAASGSNGGNLLGVGILAYDGSNFQLVGIDSSKNLQVNLNTLIAGEDQPNNRMRTMPVYNFAYISTSGQTVVKSGSGIIHTVSIGVSGDAMGIATLYDNTVVGGTVIGVYDLTKTPTQCHTLDCVFATGLAVGMTGATSAKGNLTITYL